MKIRLDCSSGKIQSILDQIRHGVRRNRNLFSPGYTAQTASAKIGTTCNRCHRDQLFHLVITARNGLASYGIEQLVANAVHRKTNQPDDEPDVSFALINLPALL